MTSPSASRRANIIGSGLMGGSIGLALRVQGWHVSGTDVEERRALRAVALGAFDTVGVDSEAEITFVAVPVRAVADAAKVALAQTTGLVTDVGSVKASVVAAVADDRFIGGHPMAGSEQEGVDGADATIFTGAVWVLTPTAATGDDAFTAVRAIVSSLGADVVALAPDRHDALVAVVSHVPHLTAATLMALAGERAEEHRAVLRLAAGGFRDMTRIAAGHPGIWPDICAENAPAILDTLDRLIAGLQGMRAVVAEEDRAGLLGLLEQAREARVNLPGRSQLPAELSEVRIPVPDRPGVIAEVATLATELDVNLFDVEVAHSAEGDSGVLIVVVASALVERLQAALVARGYRPSTRALG
ncbi:MAG: prephenate dehydrogenase/arogenate dehydrogenase family protein [Acidimicrobiales bacterium]